MRTHIKSHLRADRPGRGPGVCRAGATAVLLAVGLYACSDDPYERAVTDPEDAYDPTDTQVIEPPAQTAPPRPEQREPLQVTEDEVVDALADETAATPAPGGELEQDQPAPLDHPSRAPAIEPVGEPMDAAVPDEPTRSMDPTEAPGIDPVE